MQTNSPGKSTTVKHQTPAPNKSAGNTQVIPAPRFFSQEKSPTLGVFISGNQQIIGQAAVDKLEKKKKPSPSDVRVLAQPCSGVLPLGVKRGLHEIIPTNLIATLVKIKDDTLRQCLAEIQSGARISTALAFFNQCDPKYQADPNKQLVAHTGLFNPATAHTCGQNAVHNKLRDAAAKVIAKNLNADQARNYMINAQLKIMPNGREIMEDPGITGETSSRTHIGKITEPLTSCSPSKNKKKDTSKSPPSRVDLAIDGHERREETKARGRADKRERYPAPGPSPDGRTRSPSPPRTPIKMESKTTFSGGEAKAGYERPLPNVPHFPKEHSAAHKAAWITESLRLDPKNPLKKYSNQSN